MSKLMQEIAVLKLRELASKVYFDICALDAVLSILGGTLTKEERTVLMHAHCVHFAKLSTEARAELSELVYGVLKRYIADVPRDVFAETPLLPSAHEEVAVR